MFTVQCPKCGASNTFSLVLPCYNGPFRCWKCRKAFLINIEKERLKSCKAITEKEFAEYTE